MAEYGLAVAGIVVGEPNAARASEQRAQLGAAIVKPLVPDREVPIVSVIGVRDDQSRFA